MEENEDQEMDWEIPYEPSGLICEVCGHNDSIQCELWNWELGDNEPSEILCGEHAAKAGYCCCCGSFCAGMTSFDLHHPGFCDNCYDQVQADCGEDDDEWEDDIHEFPTFEDI